MTELDRTLYRRIKTMNREEMQRFIDNVYHQGLKDGDGVNMDYDEVKRRLSGIKGIGENRLNEIMTVLDNYMKELGQKD